MMLAGSLCLKACKYVCIDLHICGYNALSVSFQKEFELAWDVICLGQSSISDGG